MDKISNTSHETADVNSRKRLNFVMLAIYQIVMRTGWIFKTESIIMPAALDSLGGGGWIRGCLPMLNRFGQSIPPLLVWPLVRSAPNKKKWLAVFSGMMGGTFCLLACVWLFNDLQPGDSRHWFLAPLIFLALYAIFFLCTGINQMVMSTLIGKLINVKRRGRLMLTATPIGAVSAVFFAWFVLRHWLSESGGQFFLIFGFAGICFVIGGALALSLREDRDETTSDSIRPSLLFREAIRTIAGDQRFQVLVLIAAMVGMSMTLFPHYQAMARERLNLGFSSLLPWLIAQNLGVAFFSIPAGGLADRFGNRFVLRITLLLICMAPIAAIVISRLPSIGEFAFSLVFVLLGLTPVTMRILSNYALELASPEDQPRYLSTLSLCMAGPAILTSTLLGLILDLTSFEFVFGLVLVCIFTGWTLTFKLAEPRRDQPKPSGL